MHCWKNSGCSLCKQKEPSFNGKCFSSSRAPGWEFTIPALLHVVFKLVAPGAAWAQRTKQLLVLCSRNLAGRSCGFFPVLPFLIQLPEIEILLIYFCGRVKPQSSLHTQLLRILLNSINPGEKKNPTKTKEIPKVLK